MGIVFINYRRDQTAGEARALYNDLVKLLGADRVFMDVDNIALGRDFREVLRQRLDDCEVMLTLVGRGWADARDAAGRRRLEQSDDFVRLEIATALQRNVTVTPVLLQDARMPGADTLPEDLKPLAYRNGFEIAHQTWDSNVRELVTRLGLAPARGQVPAAARSRAPLVAGLAALVAAGAAGVWFATRPAPTPPSAPAPPAAPVAEPAPAAAPAPAAEPAPAAASAPGVAAAPAPAPATLPPPAAPPAAADASSVRMLVAGLVSPDRQVRQDAAAALQRDHLRSGEAVRAALAYLQWERFRTLTNAAQRAQLLNFLLATDASAWTPELRAEGARAAGTLLEQVRGNPGGFRPEMVERIEALNRRLGS